MGEVFKRVSSGLVKSTGEELLKAVSSLTALTTDMEQHGMKEIILPWTDRQWLAVDLLINLGKHVDTMAPEQVLCHRQGRVSRYEKAMQKSERDAAAKAAKDADKPEVVKKPRGRPRKKPE